MLQMGGMDHPPRLRLDQPHLASTEVHGLLVLGTDHGRIAGDIANGAFLAFVERS